MVKCSVLFRDILYKKLIHLWRWKPKIRNERRKTRKNDKERWKWNKINYNIEIQKEITKKIVIVGEELANEEEAIKELSNILAKYKTKKSVLSFSMSSWSINMPKRSHHQENEELIKKTNKGGETKCVTSS